MESITREDVEKLASSYSGACYVIIGHSRAGYAHWNDVKASVDAVIMYLDGRHGKGKWMALYGGDAPGSRAGRETVGNVMQCVKSAEPAAVVAIQSSHMQSKGRGVAASTATHVHYYPTVRVYLGSGVRCHLAGVIAFGGGLLALQEAQFALSHCVPFKYIPCRARKCLAEHAPFGAIHVWAAAVRGRVREWRSAQAFHSQEGRGSSAEAAGAGAGAGAGARAGAGAGAQLPGAVGRVVVPRLVGAQLEDRGMCLTMHQPWASLLVAGIKRVEGRGWNTSHRGPLWIHAAAKQPTPDVIRDTEQWYKQIFGLDGVTDVQFPEEYPTSALLGRVDVVAVDDQDTFAAREGLPVSVKQESESPYVWLCARPQRLLMPFRMSGQHKLWKIENSVVEGAASGLVTVTAPAPINFVFRDV